MNRLLQKMLPLFLLTSVIVGVSGCESTRVVFVPEDDGLVRLGPTMRGHVYFWNGNSWELSANKVLLPEGWYAGSIESQDETTE